MSRGLQVKVCGMVEPNNLSELAVLDIDMVGHILYDKSKRYVTAEDLKALMVVDSPDRVAVSVNAEFEEVYRVVKKYDFRYIQLHGDESPEYCARVRELGVVVIKAFSILESGDFDKCERYRDSVDYFLFDTKGKHRGGNGVKFDWSLLDHYDLQIPFLLSGGIGPEDAEDLLNVDHTQLVGVDLNSGFETSPGIKDINLIKTFLDDLSH